MFQRKINIENKPNQPVFFNNLAGVGFDGYVANKVGKYKNFGAIAYLIGALLGLFSFRVFKSKTLINSECYSFKTLMILIGLYWNSLRQYYAQYLGSLMG